MQNSIALPIATRTREIEAPPRCFIVYPDRSMEVHPYPFTAEVIEDMNAGRFCEINGMIFEMAWCVTLFFPEQWPPEVIRDFLEAPTWQTSLLAS